MKQRSSDRANRVRTAELVSLASALVVFVIVAALGVLVWRRAAVDAQPVVQAVQTVAVPRQGQSAPGPVREAQPCKTLLALWSHFYAAICDPLHDGRVCYWVYVVL